MTACVNVEISPFTFPGIAEKIIIVLDLAEMACLVGDTSFPAKSSTSLHRYYLK